MTPPVWISLTSTVSHCVSAESGPGCLVGGKWLKQWEFSHDLSRGTVWDSEEPVLDV